MSKYRIKYLKGEGLYLRKTGMKILTYDLFGDDGCNIFDTLEDARRELIQCCEIDGLYDEDELLIEEFD